MEKISKPIFNHSTLSMMNSILKTYGYKNEYPSLPKLDEVLQGKYKNIILLILDGLGNISLENISKKGFLNKNKVDVISSVFPSTTVASINTISTGVPPVVHGWLGWTSYFKEVDHTIELFMNKYVGNDDPVLFDYKGLIKYKNIFTKIKEANDIECNYLCPDMITTTMEDANNIKYKYGKFKNGCNDLLNILEKQQKNTFTYFYHHLPDGLMHIKGTDSLRVKLNVLNNQRIIKSTLKKLSKDTLLIISADHGLVNVKNSVYLADDKDLYRMLKRRTSIEGRATTFFIKDKYKEIFPKVFNQKYGEDFILKTHQEVIDEKIFGEGNPHPKFEDFIGDYLSIAIGNRCINYGKKGKKEIFKASHAGYTQKETEVPLIIIQGEKL